MKHFRRFRGRKDEFKRLLQLSRTGPVRIKYRGKPSVVLIHRDWDRMRFVGKYGWQFFMQYLQAHPENPDARPRSRIREVCGALQAVWLSNPELRLAQLLVNLLKLDRAVPELFYIEDHVLLEKLQQALLEDPVRTQPRMVLSTPETAEFLRRRWAFPRERNRLLGLSESRRPKRKSERNR